MEQDIFTHQGVDIFFQLVLTDIYRNGANTRYSRSSSRRNPLLLLLNRHAA